MLSVYDLYDLHAIFVTIRSSPADEKNVEILSKILEVLYNRYEHHEFNQFRQAIRTIESIREYDAYEFVFTDNAYVYCLLPFLKSESIYKILIRCCEELQQAAIMKQNERVACLADCLHNFPLLISENNYAIPNAYWKNEVSDYRKKWEENFLKEEEKEYKRNRSIKGRFSCVDELT